MGHCHSPVSRREIHSAATSSMRFLRYVPKLPWWMFPGMQAEAGLDDEGRCRPRNRRTVEQVKKGAGQVKVTGAHPTFFIQKK
jgi:hypothetical protein